MSPFFVEKNMFFFLQKERQPLVEKLLTGGGRGQKLSKCADVLNGWSIKYFIGRLQGTN